MLPALLALLSWANARAGAAEFTPLGSLDLGPHGLRLLETLSLPDSRATERTAALARLAEPLETAAAHRDTPGAHLALALYRLYGAHDPVAALPAFLTAAAGAPDDLDVRAHTLLCRLAYPLWIGEGPDPGCVERAEVEELLTRLPSGSLAAERLRRALLPADQNEKRREQAQHLRAAALESGGGSRFVTRSGRCSLTLPSGLHATYTRRRNREELSETVAVLSGGGAFWELRRLTGTDLAPLLRAAWVVARWNGAEPPLRWVATRDGAFWMGATESAAGETRRGVVIARGEGRWYLETMVPAGADPQAAFRRQETLALSLEALSLRHPEPAQMPGLDAAPEAVVAYLEAVAERSDWLRFSSLGRSARGRPLLAAQLGHPAAPSTGARVVALARQHGDEPAPTLAALRLIHRLALEPCPGDDALLWRVALAVVPLVNPDGAAAFRRRNGNAADLNRDWERLSQPETRAVDRFVRDWKPQLLLDLHEMLPEDRSPGYFIQANQHSWRPGAAGERFARAHAAILKRLRAVGCPARVVSDRHSRTLAHTEFARRGIPALLLESQVYAGGAERDLPRRVRFHVESVLAALQTVGR